MWTVLRIGLLAGGAVVGWYTFSCEAWPAAYQTGVAWGERAVEHEAVAAGRAMWFEDPEQRGTWRLEWIEHLSCYAPRGSRYGKGACEGPERPCERSELADDFAAVAAAQGLPGCGVDILADELDAAVAEEGADAAGVSAAGGDVE